MMNGTDLLDAYRERRSDEAFAELVRRYANLVYSVALRRLANTALAEEVSQEVFTQLASAVPRLKTEASLVAWLHRTTVHVSIDVWRSETRRRVREEKAIAMEPAPSEMETETLWSELAPQLDEALNRLNGVDRQALLLRFFDGKRMRDLGQALGVSEDAAKMRVNRALDRLRGELASRGVVCPAVTLGGLLASRSLEAAPAPLLERLAAASHSVPEHTFGFAGWIDLILNTSKDKLVAGAVILVTIGVSIGVLLRSKPSEIEIVPALARESTREIGTVERAYPTGQRTRNAVGTPDAEAPRVVRQIIHVVDSESGRGLAGVALRAVYFYAGGRGEPHELVTDEDGYAGVPDALDPNDRGMNVFAIIAGYVPQAVGLDAMNPSAEYVMRLEPARTLSGIVVDEEDRPVAGVAIRAQGSDEYRHGAANTDFQLAIATTDADGLWSYPYIPKSYEEVRLILTHDEYAVTLPNVLIEQVDPRNLVLVIDHGFTVAGMVADSQGRPVADATVRELTSTGYRKLSTTTDQDGRFLLKGVWTHGEAMGRPDETNATGKVRLRGLVGIGQPKVRIAVQAEGLAPEVRTVELLETKTTLDIGLRPPQVFRGRVVDEYGVPIPNAVVRTDTDNDGIRTFVWSGQTDAAGRFEWTSAPTEPVLFWFEAEGGYETLRDLPLLPDGREYEITLKRKAP